MESSFKVFLAVLTVVSAQNVTDYDYETTAMEETSTDNITELPKTMTSTTTVLPEHTNWVSLFGLKLHSSH